MAKKKLTQEEKDFIRGRTNKVTLKAPKRRLGFSPAQKTASGAGSHGGNKKSANKAERKRAKKDIRDQNY